MKVFKTKSFKTHPVPDFRNGVVSPSQLPGAYNCQGFRLLADTDDSPEHPLATKGKEIHKYAETKIIKAIKTKPVSYTHLTLPTILLV